ncbi:MAG: purine-nucleoside phosphorylase [Rikenellaceae bacterium]
MERYYRRLESIVEYIHSETNNFAPEVAIILGSGLGGLVDSIDVRYAIKYENIPNFPTSTVVGHSGQLIFGYLAGRAIVAMQGRFHYYEGYDMSDVTLPVRVFKLLGVGKMVVTNAAGGVNTDFNIGDLMLITDHIHLMPNPLIGANLERFGVRFVDMHHCYDLSLRTLTKEVAAQSGVALREGVYVGGTGPTYETTAEYRYFAAIGGDACGMSTTPEVIVARHCSIDVLGISVITNCGLSDVINDHNDVKLQGERASITLSSLVAKVIERL